MLPRNPSRIFRSRWRALWWAGGVCVSAVLFVGFGSHEAGRAVAAQTDVLGGQVDDKDLQELMKVLNAG
ncbi:hypothetical protein SAMN06297144_1576 [Sphingomonas guangdongensis]|uniref:Uncharacterized protein n=1 Tax=Sphingomonas guangdongensis TaxID=1141890 RepID=A0A285QX99_9SPHN|nr:hypothetical protein [Sphingomonas guangdongensis]SOB86471.1 hypothetical protein SAMN06297144_1576 [Sphingomonas guangdongensis]